MKRLTDDSLRRLYAGLAAAAISVYLGSLALGLARGSSVAKIAPLAVTDVLTSVGLMTGPLVGLLIARHRPRNAIPWIFLIVAGLAGIENLLTEYAIIAIVSEPGRWPLGNVAEWLAFWLFAPGQAAVPLVLLLFPTGRPLTARWGWVVRTLIGVATVNALGWALLPSSQAPVGGGAPLENPFGQSFMDSLAPAVFATATPAVILFTLAGVVSIVLRYRRSDADGRHQLKWFLYAASLLPISFALGLFTPLSIGPQPITPLLVANTAMNILSIVAIPAAIGIAILKYRLYDIDVVINRTLVYASLAAFITTVYVGIAVGIGALIGGGGGGKPNLGLSILATAIVAVGFQPVRERVQKVANRLVYGKRATPYEVLSQFSERVAESYASDEVMPRMARVLAEGTSAQRADVWLRSGAVWREAAVWPADAPLRPAVPVVNGTLPSVDGNDVTVPVRHQGDILGALSVGKRVGEPLTPVEEKLLTDLAGQAGLVLKNVGLSSDLQARLEELRASRQRLVTAQDEERRRLERNLHDGAQQHLVALKVKLGLAEMLLERDPDQAKTTLDQLKAIADEALETLRDLARGLYPPLLAEKGLSTALQVQARKATLPVTIEADRIGRYPQDVEGALYFCILEALQNIQKYAQASGATVRLREQGGQLSVEVVDDGCGFDVSTSTRGTGLTNMEDRLDALGGTLHIASTPGNGTFLQATVPVPHVLAVLPEQH